MKSARPKLDGEVGTQQHCANGVGNREMGTLNRTVLIGCVSASGANIMFELFEQLSNLGVVAELTTLVEVHMLATDAWRMIGQKMTQPLKRRSLGNTCIAVKTACEMVGCQNP